jgi:DNA-binding GntR family transcriptional regulator
MERRPRNQTAAQGNLDQLFESVIAVRILRYLYQAGGSPTGRGIARAVAVSHTAVARALQHLAEHEIVELRSVGRATTCTLNHAHWLAAALASLFQAEAAYRQQLGARIGAATRPAPVSGE